MTWPWQEVPGAGKTVLLGALYEDLYCEPQIFLYDQVRQVELGLAPHLGRYFILSKRRHLTHVKFEKLNNTTRM